VALPEPYMVLSFKKNLKALSTHESYLWGKPYTIPFSFLY